MKDEKRSFRHKKRDSRLFSYKLQTEEKSVHRISYVEIKSDAHTPYVGVNR